MEIKKYIDKIVLNNKKEDMEYLSELLEEIIYKMKESHYEMYEHYKMCLYEKAYGKKLSEEMAHEWVESMANTGEHWTIEETTNAMRKLNYNLDIIDFYVVANMMYSDYFELVQEDELLALKLAKKWLEDKDAVDDKLYNYWKYISKED